MEPSYNLRDARVSDIPTLVRYRVCMFEAMAELAGGKADAAVMQRMADDCQVIFRRGFGHEHVGWVAESNAQPVAGAMVWLQPWLPHPRYPRAIRPYLHSVFTESEHRGQGLARLLTERAMAWARTQGHAHFILHASEQGRPVYEKLGFDLANEWQIRL